MKTKLTEVKDSNERKLLTVQANKAIMEIAKKSSMEVPSINKYFKELYTTQVDSTSKAKAMLEKFIRTITKQLEEIRKKAAATLSDNTPYTINIFEINGIKAMLLTHKLFVPASKTIDHITRNINGTPVSAVFNNETRAPIRLDYQGNGYAVLIGNNSMLKDIKDAPDDDDEILAHELGYIKTNLTNPNTFKGFKNLNEIGDMFYNVEKKINKEMGCKKMDQQLEEDKKSNFHKLVVDGVNLIGINSLAEAKLLGELIKKDPDKELRIKVLKKIFSQN